MPEIVFDLSENVNFLGVPQSVVEVWPSLLSRITTYPHPSAEPLRTLLSLKHQLKPNNILVGNGAAELLTFFAHRFFGKRVVLIHPTFSEYKMTVEAAGAFIEELVVQDIKDYTLPIEDIKQAMNHASCLYLCNPNNPTGTLIKRNTLEQFIEHGEKVGCEILVDEAFMDWTDESNSIIDVVSKHSHVTVMRSMTKMYGIAGIRLGYLVGSERLIQEMESKLPHWNVNGLAIAIGEICLQDKVFRTKSIFESNAIKQEIEEFLIKHDCVITKSETNFLSFQLKDIKKTREFYFYCLERGVVLRHTENYKGMNGFWLRIGMKNKQAMDQFKKIMDEWYE